MEIGRLHTRYRLPPPAAPERQRLDRILEGMLASGLDSAVERAMDGTGVARGAEVCVRAVAVPVHLDLSRSDASLAAAWIDAFAEAVGRRVSESGHDVVHYRSRAEALLDMAVGVATDDLDRAWAWSQLGLWCGSPQASAADAREQLLLGLMAAPEQVVPVLVSLAGRGILLHVTEPGTGAWWRAVAVAALRWAGVDPAVLDSGDPLARPATGRARWAPADEHATTGHRGDGPPWARTRADAIVSSSVLSHAVVTAAVALQAPVARAVAILSVLEADPGALAVEDPTELVRAVHGALARAASPSSRRAGASGRVHEEHRPGRVPGPGFGTGAGAAAHVDRRPDDPGPVASGPIRRPDAGSGRTAAGGLLFLLHLLDDVGAGAAITATFGGGSRSVRWTLHHLGLALAPLEADDPAALAFAGLPPGTPPPSVESDPATMPERAAIDAMAASMVLALRDRLRGSVRLEQPDGDLLRSVWRRDAEVVAEPPWIDVHLDIDDVAVDLRRAGLDLDPGHVPLIGAVVRFVYV